MKILTPALLALALTACGGAETTPETPDRAPSEAGSDQVAPTAEDPAAVEAAPAPSTVDAEPMGLDKLNVGTERAVLVLAVAKDSEDPGFKKSVEGWEAKGWPISVVWAGCMPKVAELVGGNEQWTAGLSFETSMKAGAWAKANDITPVGIAEDTIEPCGD